MTQGESYYLMMVIAALLVFAIFLAYGSIVAPGKPHKAVQDTNVKPLPQKVGTTDHDTRKAA